jgi:Peptidase C10 family/Spi protease inhibitor/Lamin Tail Domain
MKKLFVILMLAIATFQFAFSENVSLETAQTVAANFFASKMSSNAQMQKLKRLSTVNMKVNALSTTIDQKNPAYYIFTNETNNSFVIVAGDDRCKPILGYSTSNGLNYSDLPINFVYWMKGYAQLIEEIRKDSTIQLSQAPEWKTKGIVSTANSTSAIAPLITTKWSQSPNYNNQCPISSWSGKTTVTGCVATAMAQVMRYWKYPLTGLGNHSYFSLWYGTQSANFGSTIYDWNNMPIELNSSSTSTQINAVATLMYHCGVSVDMNYGVSGSSANVLASEGVSAENALRTYFGYSSDLIGVSKKYYSEAQWSSLLVNELTLNRPILYRGTGSLGGHAFVCDGYDGSGYFHFNWGWGNQVGQTIDGYFSVNPLSARKHDFIDDQGAVIGIIPPTNYQDYKLRLYVPFTLSKSTINFGESITANFNIENYGSATFAGNYYIAILNSEGTLIDTAAVIPNKTLSAGYYHFSNLNVTISPRPSMNYGDYYYQIYFAPSGSTLWRVLGDGNYTNKVKITVKYAAPIEMNSSYSFSPVNIINNTPVIVQNSPISISYSIKNTSATAYSGSVALILTDMFTGKYKYLIGSSDNINLSANGGVYTANIINNSVDTDPGTYLLTALYQNGSVATLIGTSNYPNLTKVIIQAQPITKDSYEPNNTVDSAYVLTANLAGGKATIKTANATIHDGDIDYYKINLPTNKKYIVTAKVHDAFISTDGNKYTCDVAFNLLANAVLSSTYDTQSIPDTLLNGGSIVFKVIPFFPGETGTYALEISIQEVLPSVLITQVYGGGGNSGATYKSDFIELYNTTNSDINISGWSLYYSAATSSATNLKYEFPTNTIIKANSYFLVKGGDGTGTQPSWNITFDATCTLNLSGSAGKVILLKSNAAFTLSASPTIDEIINNVDFMDYVPFGTTAIPVWGSAMSANTTNTTSARCKFVNGQYQYTKDIGNDFEIVTANPRNSITTGSISVAENLITVFVVEKMLYIKGIEYNQDVDIYNIAGLKIYSTKVSSNSIPLNNLSNGIYIVRVGARTFKVKF